MVDISVTKTDFQTEDLSWDLSTGDIPGFRVSGLLDISAFTEATHYPNGYLLSGLVVGLITASSTAESPVVGPYDDGAVDGRETAFGILAASTRVPDTTDTTKDVSSAFLVAFAPVRLSKLPIALDAAGQADLPNLYFVA